MDNEIIWILSIAIICNAHCGRFDAGTAWGKRYLKRRLTTICSHRRGGLQSYSKVGTTFHDNAIRTACKI